MESKEDSVLQQHFHSDLQQLFNSGLSLFQTPSKRNLSDRLLDFSQKTTFLKISKLSTALQKLEKGSLDFSQYQFDKNETEIILKKITSFDSPRKLYIKSSPDLLLGLNRELEFFILLIESMHQIKAPLHLDFSALKGDWTIENPLETAFKTKLNAGDFPYGVTLTLNGVSVRLFEVILKSERKSEGLTVIFDANRLCTFHETIVSESLGPLNSALSDGQCPEGLSLGHSRIAGDYSEVSHVIRALQSKKAPRGLSIDLASEQTSRYPQNRIVLELARAIEKGALPEDLTLYLSGPFWAGVSFGKIYAAFDSPQSPKGLRLYFLYQRYAFVRTPTGYAEFYLSLWETSGRRMLPPIEELRMLHRNELLIRTVVCALPCFAKPLISLVLMCLMKHPTPTQITIEQDWMNNIVKDEYDEQGTSRKARINASALQDRSLASVWDYTIKTRFIGVIHVINLSGGLGIDFEYQLFAEDFISILAYDNIKSSQCDATPGRVLIDRKNIEPFIELLDPCHISTYKQAKEDKSQISDYEDRYNPDRVLSKFYFLGTGGKEASLGEQSDLSKQASCQEPSFHGP